MDPDFGQAWCHCTLSVVRSKESDVSGWCYRGGGQVEAATRQTRGNDLVWTSETSTVCMTVNLLDVGPVSLLPNTSIQVYHCFVLFDFMTKITSNWLVLLKYGIRGFV